MNTVKEEDVVINLKLFKRCQLYQLFDLNGKKIFNWNVYKLGIIMYASIIQFLVIYGNVALFYENGKNTVEKIDYFIIFLSILNIEISMWRLGIFLYNVNKVSELFTVAKLNFFTSKPCINNNKILCNQRNNSIRYTNWYVIVSFSILMQWIIFPIGINMFDIVENSIVRRQNTMNLNWGVDTHSHNQYFVLFFLLETNIITFSGYIIIVTDVLLISFYSAIIAQQKVLVRAFKYIGHEDNLQINHKIEEFKSVLQDQQQLNLKIQLFYSIVKHIVLLVVAVDSASIIALTYRFIVVYLKNESYMGFKLIKFGTTLTFVSIHLFIYCYLFDNINAQRALVNFSIYSCNWTEMDLKFQKLLLLAMRMNDANNLVIKASPKKIINLQLFASIISTSFNIISVMLKITKKNENPE